MKKVNKTFIPALGPDYALVSQKNRIHKDRKKELKKGIQKYKNKIYYE